MSGRSATMLTFDQAFAILAEAARPLPAERVPLSRAHRRVLAEPVVAKVRSPPFDASAMDGFAVRDSDLARLPAGLPIAGASFAGAPFAAALPAGQCVRVFTGAAIPAGADRVVVQEIVEQRDGRAWFAEPPGSARHIRPAGSDFEIGANLLPSGARLTARALVAAAAADAATVSVRREPRFIVLSTGDELAAPGTARDVRGAVPESVSYGVAALAAEWGGRLVRSVRLPDKLHRMRRGAASAVEAADLVIVTGGASVGEKDFAKAMFDPAKLQLLFSKVSIKPGKPVWLARCARAVVLGLPGNPTSAMVTARLFLAPLLCAMTGRPLAEGLRFRPLVIAEALAPTGSRETFSRAVERDGRAWLLSNQDSNAQKTLADADILVRRPPGTEPLPAGSMVEVLDF